MEGTSIPFGCVRLRKDALNRFKYFSTLNWFKLGKKYHINVKEFLIPENKDNKLDLKKPFKLEKIYVISQGKNNRIFNLNMKKSQIAKMFCENSRKCAINGTSEKKSLRNMEKLVDTVPIYKLEINKKFYNSRAMKKILKNLS